LLRISLDCAEVERAIDDTIAAKPTVGYDACG
jgi:hypothetical protein